MFTPPLLTWTEKGLHCSAGNFYIDPHRAVDVAIVTHAHSDHARRGSKKYFCAASGRGLLHTRLGKNICSEGKPYGEPFFLNGVKVSFHAAGHILGSAQVRIEYQGEVWVASGDYKRAPDPSCEPFETVACDTFITEATFGTPQYTWDKNASHGEDLFAWWKEKADEGKNCILFGYSLGKAQRILAELFPYAERPVLIHSSIDALTQCYREQGRCLAPTRLLEEAIQYAKPDLFHPERPLRGEFIIAPPSILDQSWTAQLGDYETAFASGWMKRASPFGRGGQYDRGFVISDHADWADLNHTIRETGARRVFVQHRNGVLVRHLRQNGIDAHPIEKLTLQNYARLGGESLGLFG